MRDSFGRFVARAAMAACIILSLIATATAQQPQGITEAPPAPEFLSRYDFNMSAAKLRYEDPRFSWDVHWGGDFDLVDYVYGRVTFIGDYQGVLGSEFRPFDPYQSNYLLEAIGSYRFGQTEVLGVLNHISRHLGDRFKPVAVAENSLGPRVMRRFTFDNNKALEVRGNVRKVIAHAYVDYTWMTDIDFIAKAAIRPKLGIYGRAYGQLITVDPTIAGRGNQHGGRLEAGILLPGVQGNMELFVGGERSIDADQLDRVPRRWAFVGFRLLRN
jgi:hypothetical protein